MGACAGPGPIVRQTVEDKRTVRFLARRREWVKLPGTQVLSMNQQVMNTVLKSYKSMDPDSPPPFCAGWDSLL